MKVSLFTVTTLFSTAAAFAPVKHTQLLTALHENAGDTIREARGTFAPGHFDTHGSPGDAGRAVVAGHDIHAARASYAQLGRYGEIGYDGIPRQDIIPSAGYSTSFAPGQFDSHGSPGDAGRAVVAGHDIHAARASYAQLGRYGEIGSDGISRQEIIPSSGYSASFAPGQFDSHGSPGDAGRSVVAGHDIHAARGSYAQVNRYGEVGLETGGVAPAAPAIASSPMASPYQAAPAASGASQKSYGIGSWKA